MGRRLASAALGLACRLFRLRDQLLAGKLRVPLDALAIALRHLAFAQQPLAGLETFLVTPGPIGADGKLVEQPVLVDPGLDEETAFRHPHLEAAGGELVPI